MTEDKVQELFSWMDNELLMWGIIVLLIIVLVKSFHKHKTYRQYNRKLDELQENSALFPPVANQIESYIFNNYDAVIDRYLRTKSRPAFKAAEQIKEANSKKRSTQCISVPAKTEALPMNFLVFPTATVPDILAHQLENQ